MTYTAEQLAAVESQPGLCPGLVEGSSSGAMGAVVGDRRQARSGDHAGLGERLDTLTAGQLLEALDGLPADTPVVLEVLGDIIYTDGVVIDHHEVRIVGGEDE